MEGDPQNVTGALRQLLSDRHSPEAAALFQTLMKYGHKRVVRVNKICGNALSYSEQEEVVADILLSLMQGGLARFRGQSTNELFAFVRTIAERTTWRKIRRKEKERDMLKNEASTVVEGWTSVPPMPDIAAERHVDSPLPDPDQAYLQQLLHAGSKAELARRNGVSRAAVTQRIKRIRVRISSLNTDERFTHEVWMKQSARSALLGGS